MTHSICGIDCAKCQLQDTCAGCAKTQGQPFGGKCILAACCQKQGFSSCQSCPEQPCQEKQQLIQTFNQLSIQNMPKVTELYPLQGALINLEYTLANGQKTKLLDDQKIYLGNQLHKINSDRYYGLAADENHLLVCEYGTNGSNATIIIYQKRQK